MFHKTGKEEKTRSENERSFYFYGSKKKTIFFIWINIKIKNIVIWYWCGV